jgi:hypothetical protein
MVGVVLVARVMVLEPLLLCSWVTRALGVADFVLLKRVKHQLRLTPWSPKILQKQ